MKKKLMNQSTVSGCGSVGRVVTSDIRSPWLKSNNRKKISEYIYC